MILLECGIKKGWLYRHIKFFLLITKAASIKHFTSLKPNLLYVFTLQKYYPYISSMNPSRPTDTLPHTINKKANTHIVHAHYTEDISSPPPLYIVVKAFRPPARVCSFPGSSRIIINASARLHARAIYENTSLLVLAKNSRASAARAARN